MIPVVVLTASQRDRNIGKARWFGAETYQVKPLDVHNLSRMTPELQFDWELPRRKARVMTFPHPKLAFACTLLKDSSLRPVIAVWHGSDRPNH